MRFVELTSTLPRRSITRCHPPPSTPGSTWPP